jgi:lysophospholipase L1-like esterase
MASSSPKLPDAFPTKAALAIACTLAVLTAAHFYKDHTKGIDPSIVARTIHFQWPHRPQPLVAKTAHAATSSSRPPGVPPPISAFMIDDKLALDPFFASLWKLEQSAAKQGAPTEVVTILHYGDSPTTADMITGDARAQLQQRFGNAGHGFNLIAKPWAWYGHRNVAISDEDWQSSQQQATGVGRYKQGSYGLGGAIFAGTTGAHTTYTLSGEPQASIRVYYLAAPNGGSFTVQSDDVAAETISTAADTAAVAMKSIDLKPGTKHVSLRVTSGTVKTFGVDFRTDNSGILYDSLGLNGATTTVLSRTFDPALLSQSLHYAAPQLVIINYGTNESQFDGLITTLDAELRTAIARIRTAAPGVPILIMSPMDRGQRIGGDIGTMPTIPKIVAIQKHVAETTNCAFFDTYDAMGGEGTVGRWYDAQPRLMTADFIHPTPPGAAIVGSLLVDNLYAGYDRWKRAHGIAIQQQQPVPKPVPQPSTAPQPAKLPLTTQPVEKPSAATPEPAPAAPLPDAEPPAKNEKQDEKPPETKPPDAPGNGALE